MARARTGRGETAAHRVGGIPGVRAVALARLCVAAFLAVTIDGERRRQARKLGERRRRADTASDYNAGRAPKREVSEVSTAGKVGVIAQHDARPAPLVQASHVPVQADETASAAAGTRFITFAVGFGCPIAAVAVFAATIGHVDATRAGGLGLAPEAGAGFWISVGLTCIGFTFTLARAPRRSLLLFCNLATLLFCVYALPAISEAVPRFQVAWLHAGFVEYVSRTGHVIPQLDGRFAWPGMFSATAFFDRVAGISSAVVLIRWAPLFFGVAYLAPLWTIARSFTRDRRVQWFTLWIFSIGNWVGQDYLSPQALSFLLYLVVVAMLVRWFLRDPRTAQGAQVRPTKPGELVVLTAILLAVFLACVLAHPFTPLFLVGLIAALALCRRLVSPSLAFVTALIFLSWLSWGAVAFWIGHRSQVFPGFSSAGSNVQANVGAHFANASGGRTIVLLARLAMAGALLLAAVTGISLRRRAGHREIVLVLGAALPFPLVLLQDYGGEALLRAYLFALPFLSLAAAYAFTFRRVRSRRRIKWPWFIAAAMSVIAVLGSVTVRYGNEAFEQVRAADLAAVHYAYDHSKPGDVFLALNSNVPWRYRDIETRDYETLVETRLPPKLDVTATARSFSRGRRNVLVLVTPGEKAYGDIYLRYPPGWMSNIQRQLDSSPSFRKSYNADGAQVYTLIVKRS